MKRFQQGNELGVRVRELQGYKVENQISKGAARATLCSLCGQGRRHGTRFAGRAIKIRDNTAELLETTSQRPFKEV